MATRITCARSQVDGIVFYSETVPTVGVVSSVTNEGKIQAKSKFLGVSDFLGNDSVASLLSKQLSKWIVIIIDVALVLLSILSGNICAILAAVYFSINTSYIFCSLLYLVYCMKFGNMKSLARFHAAEHKAVNAYSSLERVPTFEELKNASMFSTACGSRISIRAVIFQTLIPMELWLLMPVSGWIYLITVFLTTLICYLDTKFHIFLPLQFLFVSQPTDIELQVALEGLKVYDKMECSYQSNKEFDLDD